MFPAEGDLWMVDAAGGTIAFVGSSIGYVHLRAMTQTDIAPFERDFYPNLDRQGLIIDVRHVVVLCDQRTASVGEAFSEGFRRLGLGKGIGTRTWGGEIWLSSLSQGGDESASDAGAAAARVSGQEALSLLAS